MADTPEFDAQDLAEVFDEDNMSPDGERAAGHDGLTFEEMPDVLDVTRAVGDADDEEAVIGDDLDDSEIVELSLDGEDDDAEDDDLRARSADAYDDEDSDELDFDDQDPDLDDEVERLSPDEIELADAGDLNNQAHAEGSAKRFESTRLSDEDIDKLGYAKSAPHPDLAKAEEVKSFDPAKDRTPEEHALHQKQDELLDEGVEETFPASDPVSVKHIT